MHYAQLGVEMEANAKLELLREEARRANQLKQLRTRRNQRPEAVPVRTPQPRETGGVSGGELIACSERT